MFYLPILLCYMGNESALNDFDFFIYGSLNHQYFNLKKKHGVNTI